MSKSKKWIALIALILLALSWRLTRSSSSTQVAGDSEITKSKRSATTSSLATSANKTKPIRAPAAQLPQENLSTMTDILSQFSKLENGVNDLLAHLNRLEQNPVVTRDENPFSGEMHIVRTRKPLSGTRYFHAQYFTNDQGQAFVQHMSVEFKSSPTAMDEAVASVQKSFNLPAPKSRSESYAQWRLGDGHILWVKKLTDEDLRDDPFNAYTSADLGTIRVAVEAEIH